MKQRVWLAIVLLSILVLLTPNPNLLTFKGIFNLVFWGSGCYAVYKYGTNNDEN